MLQEDEYVRTLKSIRARLGFSQVALAERLGVSFATINRWENRQSKPSKVYWDLLQQLEHEVAENDSEHFALGSVPSSADPDFTGSPERLRILAEAGRLLSSYRHNPTFAIEASSIDPLPHQRIAVYERMLRQPSLRFLLADDAGAGKTIMTGLFIRESLSRCAIRRILIVPPAGLVGNWERELRLLFNLNFRIVEGSDATDENPFVGFRSDRIIISIDTLAGNRMFSRLGEAQVAPYDLVVFDEAHKLSVSRGGDLRIKKTDRYKLAEVLAGVATRDEVWRLGWKAQNLLLLTATPHMGKDYPYYALWRLLEPEALATQDAFNEYPPAKRSQHFIRRTKEEMVYLDGRPLYPVRLSDTLGYQLTQGEVSEQSLYDQTTEYLQYVYNRAKLLNREAARLAMSVFQRRLASSTFALLRSFERRLEKLDELIIQLHDGSLTEEQLAILQRRIKAEDDVFENTTADDEAFTPGTEENELGEGKLLQGVVATSLNDLLTEKSIVDSLVQLARRVEISGHESKFEKLQEVLGDTRFTDQKLIIFTEHRDTLTYLVRRITGLGYTDQVAQIHGGMDYGAREAEIDRFRSPLHEGGARFLICTDAAGEGINLQFCWVMINYDIPWNPARLEQRMGRIHRYGQKHNPVVIINLVSSSTREGKVLKTLLQKLDKIREELGDKVFDCIGRIFEGVSIKQYMEIAVYDDPEKAIKQLDGQLATEQVKSILERDNQLFEHGEIQKELPRLRAELENDVYFHLLPGFVRQFIEHTAPLLGLEIEGDIEETFSFKAKSRGALNRLISELELYPEESRNKFTVKRPASPKDCIWLRPGEPVFDSYMRLVEGTLGPDGLHGAVFIDPTSTKPYFIHLAEVNVHRKADPDFTEFSADELLERRLVGVKQMEGVNIALAPLEELLLLKGAVGLPPEGQRLASMSSPATLEAQAFLMERVAREMALEKRSLLLNRLPEKEADIQRGYDFREAELASARAKHSGKARSGNVKAMEALEDVKRQQRTLASSREHSIKVLHREPDLITPGEIRFIAHALVVPSSDPEDIAQRDVNVELAAMRITEAYEMASGAEVRDVHTPELARKAGLPESPGFDILSIRPNGEKRAIEVKGRAGTGDVEVSANEWAKACNLRDGYWLYVVYDCGTPNPRLVRVQDPFGKLLAKQKGSMLIGVAAVQQAAEVI